eukprot:8158959-Alexandrium_andersonii.AAC.1
MGGSSSSACPAVLATWPSSSTCRYLTMQTPTVAAYCASIEAAVRRPPRVPAADWTARPEAPEADVACLAERLGLV